MSSVLKHKALYHRGHYIYLNHICYYIHDKDTVFPFILLKTNLVFYTIHMKIESTFSYYLIKNNLSDRL